MSRRLERPFRQRMVTPLACAARRLGAGVLATMLAVAALRADLAVDARDFGLREDADAALPLRRALEACRTRGAQRLVIPPGRYRLDPGLAADCYCTPSNGDQGLQRVGLLLQDFAGLTVEADGVELLFRKPMVPVVIKGSRDVTVRGLTIDWEHLLGFQGTVVAIDPTARSYDLQAHPDCVTRISEGVLLHGEEPEEASHYWPGSQDLTWSRWFDPSSGAWLAGNPYVGDYAYRAWNPAAGRFARVEELAPGRYRLYEAGATLPGVGWTIMAKGMRTPNRRSPAVWIAESERIRLEAVTIHHAGGMGVIGEQSRDILLRRVRVAPRPGSGRLYSTTADATHFSSCAGLIEFADCELDRMMDDGTNIHGIYLIAESRLSDRQIVGRIGHFQQAGHRFAVPGDRVRFMRKGSLGEVQTVTVAAVERLNTHRLLLTFAENLDPAVDDRSFMENLSWTPDVHIHGCTFSNNVARSLLVDTAGRVLIEDNKFLNPSEHNIGGGPSPGFWFESGSLQDVTIRRNVFTLAREGPAVGFGGSPADLPPGYHRNIRIEDNEIHTRGGPFLRLKGVAGLTFRRNRIESSAPAGNEIGIDLQNCRDGEIAGNEVMGPHRYTVRLRGATTDIRVDNGSSITLE